MLPRPPVAARPSRQARKLLPVQKATGSEIGPPFIRLLDRYLLDAGVTSYLFEPLAKPPKQGNIAARMLQMVGFEGVGAATVKWHHQVYEDKMESAYQ